MQLFFRPDFSSKRNCALCSIIKESSTLQNNGSIYGKQHSDGLVQDCSNSRTLAMELLQSCAKPSISRIRESALQDVAWAIMLAAPWLMCHSSRTPKCHTSHTKMEYNTSDNLLFEMVHITSAQFSVEKASNVLITVVFVQFDIRSVRRNYLSMLGFKSIHVSKWGSRHEMSLCNWIRS